MRTSCLELREFFGTAVPGTFFLLATVVHSAVLGAPLAAAAA